MVKIIRRYTKRDKTAEIAQYVREHFKENSGFLSGYPLNFVEVISLGIDAFSFTRFCLFFVNSEKAKLKNLLSSICQWCDIHLEKQRKLQLQVKLQKLSKQRKQLIGIYDINHESNKNIQEHHKLIS